MTKSVFLKKLELKLLSLEKSEIEIILKKYEDLIDAELKKGRSQRDVIKDLGNIDLISKLYVEISEEENVHFKPKSNKIVDKIISIVDDIMTKIDGHLAKFIIEIICFVLIGIASLSLVAIPFQLIHFIIKGFLYLSAMPLILSTVIDSFFAFVLIILYIGTIGWFVIDYIRDVIKYITDKYDR